MVTTRLFNLAAACSAIVVLASIVACFVAEPAYSGKRVLSLHKRFHVSIAGPGVVPRLIMFNDLNAGPIGGGLFATIAGDQKTEGFLDTAGIYYWHLRWRNGQSLWELEVNMLYPTVMASLLPALWLFRHRLRREQRGFPIE